MKLINKLNVWYGRLPLSSEIIYDLTGHHLVFIAQIIIYALTFYPIFFTHIFPRTMPVSWGRIINDLNNKDIREQMPLLIDSPICKVLDWPLFDFETKILYRNMSSKEFPCNRNLPKLRIERFNQTMVRIEFPNDSKKGGWKCYAKEIRLINDMKMFNNFGYGKRVGPLHSITNFDVNAIMNETNIFGEKLINSFEPIGLWDSVSIQCFRRIRKIHDSYERIVPLIQHYQPEKVKSSITQTKENTSKLNPEMDSSKPKINVILFCIDAVSRLNFLRQMPETKKFFDSHSFYPFYGYHKVAYNSFPNMFGVYSGKLNPTGNDLLLDDYHKIPFLWKLFQKKGYLTTFIDDMPAYSFFSYLSGPLLTKPVNYFLRPTSVMMVPELYDDDGFDACYQEGLEKVYLWKYFMDQLKAFELRNQSHFSIVHTSRVTHNYLSYAGYLDIPLKRFMVELFDRNFHQNSIIVVLADHSLNFGPILNTESGKFEKRFPLFYLYIPDSLKLDGHNADELRKIIQNNQHLMTSHFDLHATLLHFLGFSNTTSNDTWGSSLLKPIDPYRTCELTKIPSEYCSCKPYRKIEINDNVTYYSWVAIDHINGILEREGKKRCVPLQLDNILSAFEKTKNKLSSMSGERMLLIDISTKPKMATFQVTIKLYRQHFGLNNVHSVIAHRIVNVHRTNQYGNDSHCVENVPMLRPLCLCWDRLP